MQQLCSLKFPEGWCLSIGFFHGPLILLFQMFYLFHLDIFENWLFLLLFFTELQ